jgi:hypothetical protein
MLRTPRKKVTRFISYGAKPAALPRDVWVDVRVGRYRRHTGLRIHTEKLIPSGAAADFDQNYRPINSGHPAAPAVPA